jgi:hypothetical protein
MSGHHKRFERWRAKLPERAAYLVDQVRSRMVPEFEGQGFVWYDDFAGGDPKEIGHNEIPLQRRTGDLWPTVQIRFDKRARPFFHIFFAALAPVCRKMFATEEIPREKAIIAYAPAHFSLCKGKSRSDDCLFGYVWFALWPPQKLDAEVREALALLPLLFEVFDRGIPEAWLTHDFGYVDKHFVLHGSWYLDQRRRERAR